MTLVTNPDGSPVKTSYLGTVSRVEDEACKAREITRDSLGRVKQVVEDTVQCAGDTTAPLQYLTSYTYNVQDLLTAVQQAVQPRSFGYDRAGRLETATNPESGRIDYTYDGDGNVLTASDQRPSATRRSFDVLNRVTRVETPDGLGGQRVSILCYDGLRATGPSGCEGNVSVRGVLTSAWTADWSNSYTADGLGRIIASSQTPQGNVPFTFSYTYNADGSVRTIGYPSGRMVAYDYDAAGRPKKVGLGAVGAADYVSSATYAPHGTVSVLALQNGVVETRTYNNRLQPWTITAAKGNTLPALTCGYGAAGKNNGNVMSQSIQVGRRKPRMTQSNRKRRPRSYTTDKTGQPDVVHLC